MTIVQFRLILDDYVMDYTYPSVIGIGYEQNMKRASYTHWAAEELYRFVHKELGYGRDVPVQKYADAVSQFVEKFKKYAKQNVHTRDIFKIGMKCASDIRELLMAMD